jgi:hypothetical protein
MTRSNAALVIALSVIVISGCGSESPAEPSPATETSSAGEQQTAILDGLIGRWRRPDGGYVLEVIGVAGDGAVQAAYFNPNPIHVSTAKAESWQGAAQLFVEFDDVNYRGSTYQLIHEPERDILFGTYYQAAMGQTFEVYFVRLR